MRIYVQGLHLIEYDWAGAKSEQNNRIRKAIRVRKPLLWKFKSFDKALDYLNQSIEIDKQILKIDVNDIDGHLKLANKFKEIGFV